MLSLIDSLKGLGYILKYYFIFNISGDNESTKNQTVVDIEVGNTTSLDCSVNCGMGNITTIKVICNGTKLESEGSKDVNLQIISANDCRTERSYTPCNGTDHDCPGLYSLFTKWRQQ